MADTENNEPRSAPPAGMGPGAAIVIVALVVLIVLGTRWYRTKDGPAGLTTLPAVSQKLPRLVDLGATKCIPCKMMAPILEEMKKEYAGRLEVQFIDVWENSKAGQEYGIRSIPTQIFYDATGQERFRHEGFISKEDILKKWLELGVDFGSKPVADSGRFSGWRHS